MVASLSNIPKNKNIYRFITAGKPGNCKFCDKFVEKLEAHHVSYDPEITIKLCHDCHHRVHFWPNRITDEEKLKMLKLRFHHRTIQKILKQYKEKPDALQTLIAPSKTKFLKNQQKLDIKKIVPKHNKAYKPQNLRKDITMT